MKWLLISSVCVALAVVYAVLTGAGQFGPASNVAFNAACCAIAVAIFLHANALESRAANTPSSSRMPIAGASAEAASAFEWQGAKARPIDGDDDLSPRGSTYPSVNVDGTLMIGAVDIRGNAYGITSSNEPAVNIDGTPMLGDLDIRGNPFGVAENRSGSFVDSEFGFNAPEPMTHETSWESSDGYTSHPTFDSDHTSSWSGSDGFSSHSSV